MLLFCFDYLENTRISVKVDECGWAWLVGGRKLFIWRYKQAQAGRVCEMQRFNVDISLYAIKD